MSVVGVFAEAKIGDHQKASGSFLGNPYGFLNNSIISRRGSAARVFVLGNAEEQYCWDAQLGGRRDGFAKPVERQLILARHRRTLSSQVFAVIHEERID